MKERQNLGRYLCLIAVVLGFSMSLTAQNKAKEESNNIITLTDKTYEDKISKGVVLVDYWASWCGPCRKMEPILADIAKENKISVAKLNVDDYQSFVRAQKINSIPTMIMYKNGVEVKRLTGIYSKDELLKILTPLM